MIGEARAAAPRPRRRPSLLAALAATLAPVLVMGLAVSGCSHGEGGQSTSDTDAAGAESGGSAADRPTLEGTLLVSTATSLTAAVERIAAEFSAANPDVEVVLNAEGSSTLATQVLEGAPVDVFVSADEVTMARLVDAGLVAGSPRVLAANELVIVTPPSNPADIAALDDLAGAGIVALCGTEVPCGRYAAQVLSAGGVNLDESTVTRAPNAGATLAAVSAGDAVAGIVYATDARAAGDAVAVVPLPPEVNVTAISSIGMVATSGNPAAARAFVDWVLGPSGQERLAAAGFRPPR